MKRLWLYLILIVCNYEIMANEIEDLMRLGKVYSASNLAMEFKVVLNYNTKKEETYNGIYTKNNDGLYYKVFQIETYCNKKYSVIVDNGQKLLMVGNPVSTKGMDPQVVDFFTKLKSDTNTLKNTYSIKYIPAESGKKKISLVPLEDNEFDLIEMTINPDHTLSEIKYKYKKSTAKNYVMEYTIYYTKQEIDKAVVLPGNQSKYFVIKGDKISPSKNFSDYKIIDNRFKSK